MWFFFNSSEVIKVALAKGDFRSVSICLRIIVGEFTLGYSYLINLTELDKDLSFLIASCPNFLGVTGEDS